MGLVLLEVISIADSIRGNIIMSSGWFTTDPPLLHLTDSTDIAADLEPRCRPRTGLPCTTVTDLQKTGIWLKTRVGLEQLSRTAKNKNQWSKLHRTINEGKRCNWT
ncbi:hypothetical protein LSAT2_025992 [Lamellibrachia satsuma]|nr:hypothetical protein LSAT2_025992 [Lamellibrachia satsuma]